MDEAAAVNFGDGGGHAHRQGQELLHRQRGAYELVERSSCEILQLQGSPSVEHGQRQRLDGRQPLQDRSQLEFVLEALQILRETWSRIAHLQDDLATVRSPHGAIDACPPACVQPLTERILLRTRFHSPLATRPQ